MTRIEHPTRSKSATLRGSPASVIAGPLRKRAPPARVADYAAAKEWKVPRTECVAHASSVTTLHQAHSRLRCARAQSGQLRFLKTSAEGSERLRNHWPSGGPRRRSHIVQGKAKYGSIREFRDAAVVVARCRCWREVKKFDAAKQVMLGVKGGRSSGDRECTPFVSKNRSPALNYLRSG